MNEGAGWLKKYDPSCKIISFLVLLILSALSHFWLIIIVICVAGIAWHAVALFGRLVFSMATSARSMLGRQSFGMRVPEALAHPIAGPAEGGNSR